MATFAATSNKVRVSHWDHGFASLKPMIERNATFRLAKKSTIVQCSNADAAQNLVPSAHGFVSTVATAYNEHYNLRIRPDDVWQAIVTQFAFYVNGNGEQLRDRLVDFQGKKQLVVTAGGTLFTADFGTMAEAMVDQIAKNIKDASIADWIIPNFSTTTTSDRVCASVSLMSSLQKFFDYKFSLCCGIPSVTLLGTVNDWETIRQKVERLEEFNLPNDQMKQWCALLRPVCDEFVNSIQGRPSMDFWDTCCCYLGGGSGPSYMSGWITSFSVFSAEGKWQGHNFGGDRHVKARGGSSSSNSSANGSNSIKFKWCHIDSQDLPVGTCTVPVLVDDNGTEYDTVMVAGQFCFAVNGGNELQSRNDWCLAYDGQPKAK